MERIVVWYLRMSVVYFAAGAMIGIGMLLWPEDAGYYLPVHVHMNLLGFMSMMIYGVGYHILPKFSGKHLYSNRIMNIQFWAANAGLLGMSAGWPLVAASDYPAYETLLTASAFLSLGAVVLFAFNILKTIKSV